MLGRTLFIPTGSFIRCQHGTLCSSVTNFRTLSTTTSLALEKATTTEKSLGSDERILQEASANRRTMARAVASVTDSVVAQQSRSLSSSTAALEEDDTFEIASQPKTVARAILSTNAGQSLKPKASNAEYHSPNMDWDPNSEEGVESMDPFAASSINNVDESLPPLPPLNTGVSIQAPAPKTVADYPSVDDYLETEGLKSRPIPNGNWDVEKPLKWTEGFGRRSPAYETILESIIRLRPGDDGYFDVSTLTIPHMAIVRTKEQASIVLEKLMNADPSVFHACDTEVMDIDLGSVGPVGNGYCTCVSVYSGPDFDYGLGHGPGAALWIDNLDDACGTLQEFKGWFEDERFLKVWHNYGFDRHILWNEGIDVKGFGGDTMHMARLQDSSRARGEGTAASIGYSLEALTGDLLKRRKQPMKEIFGIKRLRKDGSEGLLVDMPPVEVMQRDPRHRAKWIKYSCYDAQGTWMIREELAKRLRKMSWINKTNLYDYYWMHMRPFGEVLTDMERRGIRVDAKDYLANVEIQARADKERHVETFRQWAAKKIGADGLALNTASSVQLATFLFGGAENEKTKEKSEKERTFKVSRDELPEDALAAYRSYEKKLTEKEGRIFYYLTLRSLHYSQVSVFLIMSAGMSTTTDGLESLANANSVQLKAMCKERGLKVAGKKSELLERLREDLIKSASSSTASVANPETESMSSMTVADLRDALVARNLSKSGKKSELIDRLQKDIQLTIEISDAKQPEGRDSCVAVSLILAEAAKKEGSALAEFLAETKAASKSVKKFIDVTITSLELSPDKYTVGGAPSVTADVLRSLAGDPFSDPPKYGSVRDDGNYADAFRILAHITCIFALGVRKTRKRWL